MWTYLSYIIHKLSEKFSLDFINYFDFRNFIFNHLWREHKLSFWESADDLLNCLKFLEKLSLIELAPKGFKIKNKSGLWNISKIVSDSHLLTGITLFETYKLRIDEAINSLEVW